MAERSVHLDGTGAEGDLRVLDGGRLEASATGWILHVTGPGPARLWLRDPATLPRAEALSPPATAPEAAAPPLALVVSGDAPQPRHVLMADGRLRSLSRVAEGMACFAPGTWIATPQGARAIESLFPGDPVLTRDNGVRPVLWQGETLVDPVAFGDLPQLAPMEVTPGALGPGQPEQPLVLSPNHRVLVAENASALHFEEREVLVAARDLPGLHRARRVRLGPVRWQHLLLDSHEIILANGAWCETLQPVADRVSGFAPQARAQVRRALEQQNEQDYDAARLMLTRSEAALLAVEF